MDSKNIDRRESRYANGFRPYDVCFDLARVQEPKETAIRGVRGLFILMSLLLSLIAVSCIFLKFTNDCTCC